jgi:hypothetical protein
MRIRHLLLPFVLAPVSTIFACAETDSDPKAESPSLETQEQALSGLGGKCRAPVDCNPGLTCTNGRCANPPPPTCIGDEVLQGNTCVLPALLPPASLGCNVRVDTGRLPGLSGSGPQSRKTQFSSALSQSDCFAISHPRQGTLVGVNPVDGSLSAPCVPAPSGGVRTADPSVNRIYGYRRYIDALSRSTNLYDERLFLSALTSVTSSGGLGGTGFSSPVGCAQIFSGLSEAGAREVLRLFQAAGGGPSFYSATFDAEGNYPSSVYATAPFGRASTLSDGRGFIAFAGSQGEGPYHRIQTSANAASYTGYQSLGGLMNPALSPAPGGSSLIGVSTARNGNGQLELFVRGADNQAFRTIQTGPNSFSGYEPLGGFCTTAPTVVTSADGRVYMFVLSSGGTAFMKYETTPGGAMTDYIQLPGSGYSSQITAALNADGRIQVYVRGAAGDLLTSEQSAVGSFGAFKSLGGFFTSDPVAAVGADGRIVTVVAVEGGSAFLNVQAQPASAAHSGYISLGPAVRGTPSIARNADGRLQVIVRGMDNNLYSRTQVSATDYANFHPYVQHTFDGDMISEPVAQTNADGRIVVYARSVRNEALVATQPAVNGTIGSWVSLAPSIR